MRSRLSCVGEQRAPSEQLRRTPPATLTLGAERVKRGQHPPGLRRQKLYLSLEEVQTDLDAWLDYYNNERTHQGKMCCGRTPLQTLIAGKEAWNEKVANLNLI